jgi:hypothetical protein
MQMSRPTALACRRSKLPQPERPTAPHALQLTPRLAGIVFGGPDPHVEPRLKWPPRTRLSISGREELRQEDLRERNNQPGPFTT